MDYWDMVTKPYAKAYESEALHRAHAIQSRRPPWWLLALASVGMLSTTYIVTVVLLGALLRLL